MASVQYGYFWSVRLCCCWVAQSCLTLWDPTDCSLPGSSVHGILQARILEWVAIPFCGGYSWPRDWTQVSCLAGRFFTMRKWTLLLLSPVRLFATPWTVARQAHLSMEFPRQEYWSGLPFPSPEYLPNPGIEPRSPALQADPLPSEPPGSLNWS